MRDVHTYDIGPDIWTVRHQQYADARWQAVWRHAVTGEFVQAIGRLRPLTNPATIYIATNEQLPATFNVIPVYAAELFENMATSSRRSDFRRRVEADRHRLGRRGCLRRYVTKNYLNLWNERN